MLRPASNSGQRDRGAKRPGLGAAVEQARELAARGADRAWSARRAGRSSRAPRRCWRWHAISCCSAARMSGRSASRSEGRPAGTSGIGRMPSSPLAPTSALGRHRRAQQQRESVLVLLCARAAAAHRRRAALGQRVGGLEVELGRHAVVEAQLGQPAPIPRACSKVWRVISSSSSSASTASQPLATAAIRLICAALRVSSVGEVLRQRLRPSARGCGRRSRSPRAVMPRLTEYCDVTLPCARCRIASARVGARARAVRPCRPSAGNRSARWIWNCARLLDVEHRDAQVSVVGQRGLDQARRARVGEEVLPGHGGRRRPGAGCAGSPG